MTEVLSTNNSSNSSLGIWPGSPFREYIYEPDEYISIEESEPDAGDRRIFLAAIAKLTNDVCPPSTDEVPFTNIHVIQEPVVFDLRTTDESITGWKVFEILSVVFNIEVRYGIAEFKAIYVKDYDELAEFSVMLAPNVAEE